MVINFLLKKWTNLTPLQHFRRQNKFMQNDANHLLVVNEHGIFTDFFKIIKKHIVSLVLRFKQRCNPEPYYFSHQVKDTMPPTQNCRIIQTLSSRPQCLVKHNLVFLQAIHIRSNKMRSQVNFKSKTSRLTFKMGTWL